MENLEIRCGYTVTYGAILLHICTSKRGIDCGSTSVGM